jgi:hypothetical protein
MDKEIYVIAGVLMVFLVALLGGMFFDSYLDNQLKMECIKQRGEYVGKTCVFREIKPQ